jgi:hypothetical protein
MRKSRTICVVVIASKDARALLPAVFVQLQRAVVIADGEQRVSDVGKRLQRGDMLATARARATGQALLVQRQRQLVFALAAASAGEAIEGVMHGWTVGAKT